MKLIPLGDKIVIRKTTEDIKNGIIIPDEAKEKATQGLVMAISARIESVKIGDTVLFAKWSGTEFKIDGELLSIMKEEDLIAILEK